MKDRLALGIVAISQTHWEAQVGSMDKVCR